VVGRVVPTNDTAGLHHGLTTRRLAWQEPRKSYKAASVEKRGRAIEQRLWSSGNAQLIHQQLFLTSPDCEARAMRRDLLLFPLGGLFATGNRSRCRLASYVPSAPSFGQKPPQSVPSSSTLPLDESGCKLAIFSHRSFELFIIQNRLTNRVEPGRKIRQLEMKNRHFPTFGSCPRGHKLHTNADSRKGLRSQRPPTPMD